MKSKRLYSGLMALGLACTLIFQTPVLAAEETAETQTSSISTNSISGWPQGPDITSTAAMIMEDSTQTTVYAKNMDQVLYPGATVKVMTTLLTLENAQLSDQVTMTATGVSGVTDGGASISAQLDEVFTVEQCLYAIMLASANDVALQIAEQIGATAEDVSYENAAKFGVLPKNVTVHKGATLFPRIDMQKELEELAAAQAAAHPQLPKYEGVAELIDIEHFGKVDLRVAQIKECEPIKRAKKLLKLQLDDGFEGGRQVVSGIAPWYKPEDLIGKKVVVVANLKPAKLCGEESCGMILAADVDDKTVKVLFVDDSIPNGSKLR